MLVSKYFNTQDLVLKVNTKVYDPAKVPISDWQRFIDVLCQNRDYQKEAIKTAIIYLASQRYRSVEDLVNENYRSNEHLRLRYNTAKDYLNKIQLKEKLSGTVDLATATGKSFVIYGIAQIALGIGLVDKVLVLGPPSLTIEKGLTDKFLSLSSNSGLISSIPPSRKHFNPAIINGESTIKDNCICIENINAVYSKAGSSIHNSLAFHKGQNCLVLCDEVHHAYNPVEGRGEETISIKRWKEFLLDPIYGFHYLLGFTGTAYLGNEYFNDVIFRYSLRQAIEDKVVKNVNYVIENTDQGEHERFQKILQNHLTNKITYPAVKPLTILVTKDIRAAKQLKTRLIEFLVAMKQGTDQDLNEQKILLVTSDKDHRPAIRRLPLVDESSDPVEWIISVSMLTEGWDVKNVFHIVPMEEKAFNSKLLIAQVLGRGLRIPPEYPNAEVTVFNHDKWSTNIKDLVQEILEMESRIRNSPIEKGNRSQYHFDLYNINYTKNYNEVPTQDTKIFNYKEYIEFITETFEDKTETKFLKINDKEYTVTYQIEKEKFLIEDIVNKVFDEFQLRKLEGVILRLNEKEYTSENLPTKEVIEQVIKKSMEKVGMSGLYLGKSNRQAVFSAFNTLLRRKPRSISFTKVSDQLVKIHSSERDHETVSVLSLKNDTSIFYSAEFETEVVLEDSLTVLKEVIADESRSMKTLFPDINPYLLKTPIDLVFATGDPERKFIKELIREDNAKHINGWIKSKNQSFYSLEYTLSTKAGRHSSQHQFSPDFFILVKQKDVEFIVVVEIKVDNDDSEENKAKYKYAMEHFYELNSALESEKISQRYFFHFLGPNNYGEFFTCLRDGRLLSGKFRSELDKKLSNEE